MNPQFQETISKLSDEELLELVEHKSGDYRKEALDYAARELESRGVAYSRNVAASPIEDVQKVEKPKPSVTEQVAMALVTLGIGITFVPFMVKFMGGMRSMSDAMVMIAVLGVVLLIVGVILAVISRGMAKRQRQE